MECVVVCSRHWPSSQVLTVEARLEKLPRGDWLRVADVMKRLLLDDLHYKAHRTNLTIQHEGEKCEASPTLISACHKRKRRLLGSPQSIKPYKRFLTAKSPRTGTLPI